MSLKMNALMAKTDTAKSTILYYLKEGLLPQPLKPKPNLHLYDEACVERIALIKYLQKHFNASIAELKGIIVEGSFDFDKGFESILETLDVLMGSAYQESFTTEALCEQFGVTLKKLEEYHSSGLLFKREGKYTQKEVEILQILLRLERLNIAPTMLEAYISQARQLALLEVKITLDTLASCPPQEKNETVKALLDTTLIIKPYLYNMHTLQAYQHQKATKESL